MPIPAKQIPIDLESATPTPMTVAGLKTQLTDVGLTCPDSDEKHLAQYISDVKKVIPHGGVQTWTILKPGGPGDEPLAGLVTGLADSSTGNWQPSDTALGYATTLEYIQYGTHFTWLEDNRPSFTGIVDNPPAYTGKYGTIDAVKNLFVEVGTTASATLVKGLDKDSIESVLSNAIAPLNDKNARNFDQTDSRVIFLVENYDPTTRSADGIGVLTIEWHLTIHDYRKKSKDDLQHDTRLEIKSHSVIYDSLDAMNADYLAAKAHFKDNSFKVIPPKNTAVQIYDSRPPANNDTFQHSLPTKATTDELEVIVLYAPDLQNVGCIDNSASDTTTNYTKSVTSGFTFSTQQTFSAEASFEASAEVVKAGVKIGFSISFTEQWSNSTTETFTFSVPPAKKAFTYQGTLLASTLVYDASNGTFAYKDTGRFLTNILATSAEPLVDPTP